MTALPCPESTANGPCAVTEEYIGELAAHLIASHAYERPDAVQAAKRVQSQVDPFGLDRNDIKKNVGTNATAEGESTRLEKASGHAPVKEAPVPHFAKPDACKVCKRLAPIKCKRHEQELVTLVRSLTARPGADGARGRRGGARRGQ